MNASRLRVQMAARRLSRARQGLAVLGKTLFVEEDELWIVIDRLRDDVDAALEGLQTILESRQPKRRGK